MPKLSDDEVRKAVHAIIFGPPKSGKTKLAGDLAEFFNLYVFDFENGSMTLHRSIPKEFHHKVTLFKIPDTKEFPIGIETALKVVTKGKFKICDAHGKISCPQCVKEPKALWTEYDNTTLTEKDIVIFDSLTQLSNSAMNHIGLNKPDTWKPEWEHFRFQGNMLDRFLGNIQNAPYHVIVISHENEVEQNDGKQKLVPVAGTRNFSRNTAKYFDEVIYTYVENYHHKAASSTTHANNILTGSRSQSMIEADQKKDIKAPISLLPIFVNQGIITQEEVAKSVLLKIKEESKGK